jgi:hypothetical protein
MCVMLPQADAHSLPQESQLNATGNVQATHSTQPKRMNGKTKMHKFAK